MDELMMRISKNLGVSQETARKSILIMADYLKSKLPEPNFEKIRIILDMPEISEEEIKELGLFKYP